MAEHTNKRSHTYAGEAECIESARLPSLTWTITTLSSLQQLLFLSGLQQTLLRELARASSRERVSVHRQR